MTKFAIALMGLLFAANSQATVAKTVLTCTQKQMRPGAPVYSLQVAQGEVADTWLLKERTANPNATPKSIVLGGQISVVDTADGTFIFTSSAGRSGYAHFYVSTAKKKAIIDINLFMKFNTSGPITDYVCKVD